MGLGYSYQALRSDVGQGRRDVHYNGLSLHLLNARALYNLCQEATYLTCCRCRQ